MLKQFFFYKLFDLKKIFRDRPDDGCTWVYVDFFCRETDVVEYAETAFYEYSISFPFWII